MSNICQSFFFNILEILKLDFYLSLSHCIYFGFMSVDLKVQNQIIGKNNSKNSFFVFSGYTNK